MRARTLLRCTRARRTSRLDCVASGALAGSTYDYVWAARGDTPDTALLIAGIDGPAPTFAVPEEVAADTDYEYTLTASAENADDATENVTVTVLNRKALDVACVTPSPVYEGSADIALDCVASGALAGSTYDYVWAARGDTPDTALLIAGIDGPAPTFAVPEEVAADETYEYTAYGFEQRMRSLLRPENVTVTVLNKESACARCVRSHISRGIRGFGGLHFGLRGFGRSGRRSTV